MNCKFADEFQSRGVGIEMKPTSPGGVPDKGPQAVQSYAEVWRLRMRSTNKCSCSVCSNGGPWPKQTSFGRKLAKSSIERRFSAGSVQKIAGGCRRPGRPVTKLIFAST